MTTEQTEETFGRVSVSASRLRLKGDGTEGVLLGTRCQACELYLFGNAMFCPRCTSAELASVELSSTGTLYSYTVIHAPPPGWKGRVPYVLGSVQLPEGPQVTTEVIDVDPQTVCIGTPMRLVLRVGDTDDQGREIMVYKWQIQA